ncbi:hypothetical protein BDN72DRAFT_409600 [Pluteus cervinus]|uniref:Uncharacterized protein n=1 Tax=Pluteus cervinus TaxID=181527 RepID=A0ACD3B1G3_9AGAR|nr:hypothetical protein BDN72DRAFT_409600 [Pluteus cervinus]
MRAVFTSLLAFAASTLAYQVTFPGGASGWTDSGAQVVTWQRVDTDRLNFTIVLVNQVCPRLFFRVLVCVVLMPAQNPSIFPNGSTVLAALVDGLSGNTTVNPPSGGWPDGTGFRVNLVQDAADLNAILAQSTEFSILPDNTTSSIKFPTPSQTPNIQTGAPAPSQDPNAPGSGTTPPNAGSSLMIPSGVAGLLAVAAFVFA